MTRRVLAYASLGVALLVSALPAAPANAYPCPTHATCALFGAACDRVGRGCCLPPVAGRVCL